MSSRSAFTLIEMLVVIAIIALLLSLSAGASIKYLDIQEKVNTQFMLDRTEAVLKNQWAQHKSQVFYEKIDADTHQWIAQYLAGNDPSAENRIRVIYVKLKQRQAFPMNFNEALYPPLAASGSPCPCAQLQPLTSYVQYLKSRGIGISSGLSWESSACLLMALQRGVGNTGISPEDLTRGGFASVDVSYGVPILTDSWKNPVYFSRVPSGCPVLNPNGAQNGAHDPGDPQGYLQMATWGTTYGPLFSSITQQQLAPANQSFVLKPMLASQGPQRWIGMNPTTFAVQPGSTSMFSKP